MIPSPHHLKTHTLRKSLLHWPQAQFKVAIELAARTQAGKTWRCKMGEIENH